MTRSSIKEILFLNPICKNIGYFYLKELYSSLGISDFFDKVCSGRKIAFNPNMINMVLTFSRILDPGKQDAYFKRILLSFLW